MPRLGYYAVAAALAFAAAGPSLADVRAGVEAYQRGDYAAALREWRPLAERGDPDAQFNLAQAHRLGRGVPADLNTAIDLYRKAATQGHAEAEALLAIALFQNGRRAEAMPWLAKAAERGDASSQFVYGTALFNGDLVAPDWPRAYSLMTQAAAQGLPPARSALIEMDKHIPLAQREQGVALARSAPGARSMPTRTARATPARTAPPVRSAGTTWQLPRAPASNRAPAADNGPPARPIASAPKVAAAKVPVVARPARPKPVAAGPAVARPVVASAPGRGWKVQLGAFSQPGNASALFASLKKRVGALSGAQPIMVRAGAVTRLQAGPFASRAAAASTCAAVKAAGSACLVVAP